MAQQCYAMVKGSRVRVTGLNDQGRLSETDPVRYLVSKAITKVEFDEVAEDSSRELVRAEDDTPRLHFARTGRTIRFTATIEITRTDPGILTLLTGVPLVTNAAGDYVGFDANTRLKPRAFALEVWSKIAGAQCVSASDPLPFTLPHTFGTSSQQWGYTLIPYLKGGVLSGFEFKNGLVSFTITKIMTRRNPGWVVGPYDLFGAWKRLESPVSGNTAWRTMLTTVAPPAETVGVATFDDIVYGGTADATTDDVINGYDDTDGNWIIYGGTA